MVLHYLSGQDQTRAGCYCACALGIFRLSAHYLAWSGGLFSVSARAPESKIPESPERLNSDAVPIYCEKLFYVAIGNQGDDTLVRKSDRVTGRAL